MLIGGWDYALQKGDLFLGVDSWPYTVFAARLMDDLLRACFERSTSEAEPYLLQPPVSSQQSALEVVSGGEALPVIAASSSLNAGSPVQDESGMKRLQSIFESAVEAHLAQTMSAALQSLQKLAALSPGAISLKPSASLEEAADPFLEAADRQLRDLDELGGSESGESDWLVEEARQQTDGASDLINESASGAAWQADVAEQGAASWEAPALQPFLDFDDELSGTEELEAGGVPSPTAKQQKGNTMQQRELSQLMHLEPFQDFDEGLPGAGMALEDAGELNNNAGSVLDQLSSGGDQSAEDFESEAEESCSFEATQKSHQDDNQLDTLKAQDRPGGNKGEQSKPCPIVPLKLPAEVQEVLSVISAYAEFCGRANGAKLTIQALLAALGKVVSSSACWPCTCRRLSAQILSWIYHNIAMY